MLKAAKGGQTSRVNGEFYKGGRFFPETGEYCGLGKNRVSKAAVEAVNAKLTNAKIDFNEKAGVFQLSRLNTLADGSAAWQVLFSAASLKTLEKLVTRP